MTAAIDSVPGDAGDFAPAHVIQRGDMRIDVPPELALALFTAPGEVFWIEDWDPTILSGNGLQQGTVFVTNVDEKTTWIVLAYDTEALHARYARVAPNTRAGTVDVRLRSDGAGGTVATITYEMTGLSEQGNAMLADIDADSFAAMLRQWERDIRAANLSYPLQLRGGSGI